MLIQINLSKTEAASVMAALKQQRDLACKKAQNSNDTNAIDRTIAFSSAYIQIKDNVSKGSASNMPVYRITYQNELKRQTTEVQARNEAEALGLLFYKEKNHYIRLINICAIKMQDGSLPGQMSIEEVNN